MTFKVGDRVKIAPHLQAAFYPARLGVVTDLTVSSTWPYMVKWTDGSCRMGEEEICHELNGLERILDEL